MEHIKNKIFDEYLKYDLADKFLPQITLFHFFFFSPSSCFIHVLVHVKYLESEKGCTNSSTQLPQKTLPLKRLVSSLAFTSVTSLRIE